MRLKLSLLVAETTQYGSEFKSRRKKLERLEVWGPIFETS